MNSHHRLSIPQPHRAPAPIIHSNSLVSHSVSHPTSLAGSISSSQPASQLSQDHSFQSRRSNPTQCPAQRPAKSAATQQNSQPKEKNYKKDKDSGLATKTFKAILDDFLSPSCRLPQNLTLPNEHTFQELYDLEPAQLRTLADKHSKRCGHGGMSEGKKQALRDFNTSTEKLLAILCIHLSISQDVAAAEIGKWVCHRSLRNYDYFKKSKEVSEIYRANGGATDPKAIDLVSKLWASLSQVEKDTFVSKESEPGVVIVDNVNENTFNMEEICDNHPTQTGLVTFVRGENDEVTRKNGFRKSSGNLEFSRNKCREFVSTFIKKANDMSRMHPVQFAISAVSTHLTKHCFQYMATTPGLWDWAVYDLASAKSENTTSKMQAFVTGKAIAGLARPKRAKGSMVELERLKATLNKVIRKATDNPNETWKWSNAESRLEDKGFKLRYEPSDSAYRSWITGPNSGLTEEKARRINTDLVSNPVSLIPIEGFVDMYNSGRSNRRKRAVLVEEEEE